MGFLVFLLGVIERGVGTYDGWTDRQMDLHLKIVQKKKNQKTHLGDPKIYQVEGMDIPKQEVAKFS